MDISAKTAQGILCCWLVAKGQHGNILWPCEQLAYIPLCAILKATSERKQQWISELQLGRGQFMDDSSYAWVKSQKDVMKETMKL